MTLSTSAVAVCCSAIRRGGVRLPTQLVEQPRVLDGDHGLSGEVLHQLDLLVSKGANFLAEHGERTDKFVVFQHRDGEKRPHTAKFDSCDCSRVLFQCRARMQQIDDVDRHLGRHHPTEKVSATEMIGERLRTSAKAGGVLCVVAR